MDEKFYLWTETANLAKIMVWSEIYIWHEKCGCGHNYIHVIENSINENTNCIMIGPTFGLCVICNNKIIIYAVNSERWNKKYYIYENKTYLCMQMYRDEKLPI